MTQRSVVLGSSLGGFDEQGIEDGGLRPSGMYWGIDMLRTNVASGWAAR